MIERHYKTAELAELLGIHPDILSRLVARSEISPTYVGRMRRFPRSEIIRFLTRGGAIDRSRLSRYSPSGWSSVYVVSNEHAVKVGITTSIAERAAAIATASGFPISIEKHWRVSAADAVDIEHAAHWLLREYRLLGEWFACDVAVAVAAVESCLTALPTAYLLGHPDETIVRAALAAIEGDRA